MIQIGKWALQVQIASVSFSESNCPNVSIAEV